MNIIYKRLSETEINTVIKLRIEQLTEEYTSAGKTVPEGVDLNQPTEGWELPGSCLTEW